MIKIEKSELWNKMTIDYDFWVRVRYEWKIEIYIPNDLQWKWLVLLRCNEYVDLKNFETVLSTVIGDLKRYIYDHELKNPQNEFAM